ncbi:hypothetical protein AOXY_G31406 [Acipenser oxyrinchus oxyrinchus]|uniref:Uncharacterized protein n=1 Tax=Acipenser oxyrinchus oxyrinchus TaxID=40147 RepID=A0AAD8CIM2_ACIOX|nr:hypothetical protein AOXY_G31406 [Acipenser oxyrinchus oxyrinchus]
MLCPVLTYIPICPDGLSFSRGRNTALYCDLTPSVARDGLFGGLPLTTGAPRSRCPFILCYKENPFLSPNMTLMIL